MDFLTTMRSDQSRRPQPRWTVILFFFGLVFLVALRKYSSPDDGTSKGPFPSSVPPMRDGQRSAEGNGSASDDWTPKSRDVRNVPPVEESDRRIPRVADPSRSSHKSAAASEQTSDRDDALLIHNVIVFDEEHHVVYRGDVNLGPTLKRIGKGVRLRLYHDGIVFENREHRLPTKTSGYYREYVQPTSGIEGPGAQRIVIGAEGEVFYSSDHYRTFRRVR